MVCYHMQYNIREGQTLHFSTTAPGFQLIKETSEFNIVGLDAKWPAAKRRRKKWRRFKISQTVNTKYSALSRCLFYEVRGAV